MGMMTTQVFGGEMKGGSRIRAYIFRIKVSGKIVLAAKKGGVTSFPLAFFLKLRAKNFFPSRAICQTWDETLYVRTEFSHTTEFTNICKYSKGLEGKGRLVGVQNQKYSSEKDFPVTF